MGRMPRPANTLILILFAASTFACSLGAPTASIVAATVTPTRTAPTQAASQVTRPPTAGRLNAFSLDLSEPFYATPIHAWSPAPYAGPSIGLPIELADVANGEVLAGLTPEQQRFLTQNGFVVIRSGEAQFNDIRFETAYVNGQPFFRTVDEAYHALHLQFDDLLKALERQILRTQMLALLTATRDQVHAYAEPTQGTSIESDTALAEAYLEVAIHLFDPSAPPSQVMPAEVEAQLKQIMDAGGRDMSVLFPDFEDDYGAYKPVGHYAGDPDLEGYFRGMTWLGRVHFALGDAQDPSFEPSRVPLIITLAMREADADGWPASTWSDVNRLLDFLVGPTDDLGPLEYAALMDQVYGPDVTISGLADDAQWGTFLASTDNLPAPQINSTFADFTSDLQVEKGWRLMGQRFTMDADIFQSLIFDQVGVRADGAKRDFPTGLDVMAVFGSGTAMDALQQRGDMTFPNYPENLEALKGAAAAQPEFAVAGPRLQRLAVFVPAGGGAQGQCLPTIHANRRLGGQGSERRPGQLDRTQARYRAVFQDAGRSRRRWTPHVRSGAELRRTQPAGLLPHGLHRPDDRGGRGASCQSGGLSGLSSAFSPAERSRRGACHGPAGECAGRSGHGGSPRAGRGRPR